MSQNNDILQDAVQLGLGEGQIAANIEHGATLGVGIHNASLDAVTPLVFTPTVFVVLHTPTMYRAQPIVGKTIKTTCFSLCICIFLQLVFHNTKISC